MTYAHRTLRTLSTCDISLGLLTLPTPDSGDFVELTLLHTVNESINNWPLRP